MTISLSKLWDETFAFARNERGLLLPLAFATCGLANMSNEIILNQAAATGTRGLAALGIFATFLLSLVGQLAIMALALAPGSSVAEALQKATRTLPRSLLLFAIGVGCVLIAAIPFVAILQATGSDLTVQPPKISGAGALLILITSLMLTWLAARLVTVLPRLVATESKVGEALRQEFTRTKPVAGKLFALLALVSFASLIMISAAGSAAGAVVALVTTPAFGKLAAALAAGVVSALLAVYMNVFIVRLYQDLARPSG